MAKQKTRFFCQNCGAVQAKWMGKCPSCEAWNTIVEEVVELPEKGDWKSAEFSNKDLKKPRPITSIGYDEQTRIITLDNELNRVLGGGIVPGSVVLLGGEPGIGKSTLLLQIAMQLKGFKVLYVSGEESGQQLRMRAERIGELHPQCYVLTETSTQSVFKQIEQLQPDLVIIDSIQTLHSSFVESGAGSVSQIRECAAELIKFAKESTTPVIIVGHITKEGTIAGPKILEHMVDTVLQFEGDRHLSYRILRTHKNRFGSTAELGIYEMRGSGLMQINNPSEILLSQRDESLGGVAIAAAVEGNRPLLLEIQSLVSYATYATPQRSTTGYDPRRVSMLLAVLEKRGGYKVSSQDVFLNIAGGIRVEDPSVDLAVCASIISSFRDIPLKEKICFAGEVGLGGEIRAVSKIENRIMEAARLGFHEIVVSKYNSKFESDIANIKVTSLSNLHELFGELF